MVAKRLSTKTSQPLMHRTPHTPAKLLNRYLFDHDPLGQQTLYRTDELSYVRATLKQQLTNRYRYGTDISHSRNRELIVNDFLAMSGQHNKEQYSSAMKIVI